MKASFLLYDVIIYCRMVSIHPSSQICSTPVCGYTVSRQLISSQAAKSVPVFLKVVITFSFSIIEVVTISVFIVKSNVVTTFRSSFLTLSPNEPNRTVAIESSNKVTACPSIETGIAGTLVDICVTLPPCEACGAQTTVPTGRETRMACTIGQTRRGTAGILRSAVDKAWIPFKV